MTPAERSALEFARDWLEKSKERTDHAMRYWAYEWDAERMARFIVSGIWLPKEAPR